MSRRCLHNLVSVSRSICLSFAGQSSLHSEIFAEATPVLGDAQKFQEFMQQLGVSVEQLSKGAAAVLSNPLKELKKLQAGVAGFVETSFGPLNGATATKAALDANPENPLRG